MRPFATAIAGMIGSGLWAAPVASAPMRAPLASCVAPKGAETLQSIGQLPQVVQVSLHQDAGDLSPIGGPFDATDVVIGMPHFRRLVFIWHSHKRWLIATERGGIAYSTPVYLYELSPNGKSTKRIQLTSDGLGDVCSAARASLVR